MRERVTIGVPVYRGEMFVEETLRSIQQQTYREFEVIISVDGPDAICEELCTKFLDDSRFRLVVQPERRGWVGNLNWLLSQVTTDYWYFHQQDDLTADNYLQTLVDHARRNPAAALVYCDLVPFGRVEGPFAQPPSVTGKTAFTRQMTMLHEHFPAFAFRGLTRAAALREAGPVPNNDVNNFGVDIAWLTGIARFGELHHVPLPLYRKRYHANNTESAWWAWPKEQRLNAWPRHCADMLGQALHIEGTAAEQRLLWLAAVERLASPLTAGHFLPVAELAAEEHMTMFARFMEFARTTIPSLEVLLDAPWDEIRCLSESFRWKPREAPVDIVGFGPNPVVRGQPFNVQPDETSAIWVRTSCRPTPGSRIRLGNTVLETTVRGTLLTARVPAAITEQAGVIDLVVVGPDGVQSRPAAFCVVDG